MTEIRECVILYLMKTTKSSMTTTTSAAYRAGLVDGTDWDLEGFESIEAARAERDWSTATINAMGASACARAWGVDSRDAAAWAKAIEEYDAGVCAAIASREVAS